VKRSLAPVGQQLEQEEQSRLELSEPKPKKYKKIQKYYIYKTKHFSTRHSANCGRQAQAPFDHHTRNANPGVKGIKS